MTGTTVRYITAADYYAQQQDAADHAASGCPDAATTTGPGISCPTCAAVQA